MAASLMCARKLSIDILTVYHVPLLLPNCQFSSIRPLPSISAASPSASATALKHLAKNATVDNTHDTPHAVMPSTKAARIEQEDPDSLHTDSAWGLIGIAAVVILAVSALTVLVLLYIRYRRTRQCGLMCCSGRETSPQEVVEAFNDNVRPSLFCMVLPSPSL